MKRIFLGIILMLGSLSAVENAKHEKPYRILSFDGGGIRAVFTLKLLSMLEEELHFLQNVDFFAGTSTGSIVALGLAKGMSPEEILQFYIKSGPSIFTHNSRFDLLGYWSKYSQDGLRKAILNKVSESLSLSDLPKKCLAVSFELYNETKGMWTPSILDNFDSSIAKNITFVDTILRSSAAPTYFSSYQRFIDGGVVANNPSMVALARAIDREGGKQKLESLRLFSMGTGLNQNYINKDVDWGIVRWMVPLGDETTSDHPLIDILFDGNMELADYQCRQLLDRHYFRLNATFAGCVGLDDSAHILELIQSAKNFPESDPHLWNQLKEWIKVNFCN